MSNDQTLPERRPGESQLDHFRRVCMFYGVEPNDQADPRCELIFDVCMGNRPLTMQELADDLDEIERNAPKGGRFFFVVLRSQLPGVPVGPFATPNRPSLATAIVAPNAYAALCNIRRRIIRREIDGDEVPKGVGITSHEVGDENDPAAFDRLNEMIIQFLRNGDGHFVGPDLIHPLNPVGTITNES